MRRKAQGLAVFAALAAMFSLVFAGQAFALADDSILSQHVTEADGTTGQDTNSGSGVKTGHIQDGAITTLKIVNGAVTDAKITGPISGSKLGSHGHDASDIVAGTIGVDRLATYAGVRVVHQGAADGVNTFNTVAAALNSITDNSASNRYVVRVMPGIYNGTIYMKSYVDIVGSGQENTTVTEYVDWGASNAALENLRVLGQIGYYGTYGVMRDVTLQILDSYSDGIVLSGPSSFEIYDSKIILIGGTWSPNIGIWSNNNVHLFVSGTTIDMTNVPDSWSTAIEQFRGTMVNSIITVNSGRRYGYGLSGLQTSTISNSKIIVECDTDESGGGCYGMEIYGDNVRILNSEVSAVATTQTVNPAGVYSGGRVVTIENSRVSSSHTGVLGSADIDNSKIIGAVAGIDKASGSFRVGASQISGGHNGVSGVDKVINCHDGNYNSIPNL